MIIERLVNAFDEFVKRIKRIDMTIFDINVYWNVTSNTSVASSSTFKLFMLISNFAAFRSSEKFKIDTRMRSQNAERFKRIAQQIFKKLNFEESRVESPSDQFMKDWKKERSKARLSVRDDCSSWLLDIVAIVYSGQGTTTNWGGDVCHGMNPALSKLFLLFLYWTSVLFRSFIYTSASIAFRP